MVETVQLVELRQIQFLLHKGRIFQLEALVLLERDVLDSHMLKVVEVGVAKLVEVNLHVWLHQSGVASVPSVFVVASGHICHIQEVIAVVHQNCVECGGVEVLDFLWLKSEHNVEHLAFLGFNHWLWLHRGGFFHLWRRLVRLHEFALEGERAFVSTGFSAALPHYHHFASLGRAFKPIFIFHIHDRAFHPYHASASHIIQEAHNIVNFHHNFLSH